MNYSILLNIFLLIASLVALWYSSDKSVEYSIKLSNLFGLTTFFIGFVLIAVATGLPELAVSITSLWSKVPGVAVGTIIGSNLSDVSLVLGLPALFIGTLYVKQEDKLHLLLMLFVTSIVMALIFIISPIVPYHGTILIIIYAVIIWWLWKTESTKIVPKEKAIKLLYENNNNNGLLKKITTATKLSISLIIVMISSKFSVDAAVFLANKFAYSLEAIGATIFAVGTSLPELALSFQSVKQKEYSLAFGNSFGSILEQATLILGILALGSPTDSIKIKPFVPIAPLMFLSYGIVGYSLLKKSKTGKQVGLSRIEGAILTLIFAIHVVYYFYFSVN